MYLKLLSIIVLILSLSGCSEPPYKNLNNDELKVMIDQGIPVYDIRRPDEWSKTGIIEASHLLTFVDQGGRLKQGFLPRFTQAIAKDQPVILICRTGNRTDALARHLVEKMGYTQIYNVRNGITHWIDENRPVKPI